MAESIKYILQFFSGLHIQSDIIFPWGCQLSQSQSLHQPFLEILAGGMSCVVISQLGNWGGPEATRLAVERMIAILCWGETPRV